MGYWPIALLGDHRWHQNVERSWVCHWCFLAHFDFSCDLLLNRSMTTWNLFVLYNKKTNYYWKPLFFTSKSFNITWKPAFAHFDKHKKAIWHNLLTIQHEAISLVVTHSKRILNGPRKSCYCQLGSSSVTLGVKTSSKSRIELQNLQILKKMLKSQVSFCHQSSPVSQKAWMFALNIAGLEKCARKTCRCG